jgi:hypothetical protein
MYKRSKALSLSVLSYWEYERGTTTLLKLKLRKYKEYGKFNHEGEEGARRRDKIRKHDPLCSFVRLCGYYYSSCFYPNF